MKQHLCRFTSFLLSFCMILSLAPTAFADETVGTKFSVTPEGSSQAYYYTVTKYDDTAKEVEFSSPDTSVVSTYSGEITVPSEVTYNEVIYTVTSIGSHAFDSTSITKVTLPETIKTVTGSCFYCDSKDTTLTEVVLGSGTTEIGAKAFYNRAGLTKLTIPDSVTKIGQGAFENCSGLTSLSIPSGVTEIGASTFSGCTSLTSLTIPDSVTSIGMSAFMNCSALESLTIPAGVTSGMKDTIPVGSTLWSKVTFAEDSPYKIVTGVLYSGTSMEGLVDKTVLEVIIPEGVTDIPEAAFKNYNNDISLTSVSLPSTLKTIGKEAFYGCSELTSIEIPQGVTEIPEAAFQGCVSLMSISLPEGLTTIGDNAFNLTEKKTKSNGKTSYQKLEVTYYINENPVLKIINIPSTVTSLGNNFLAGLKPDGDTAVIFEGTSLPTFLDDALSKINGEEKIETAKKGSNTVSVTYTDYAPSIFYPAEAVDAYTDKSSPLVKAGLVTAPSGEGGNDQNEQGYALSLAEIASVEVGKTAAPNVTSTIPTDATLEWTSSDESVATVSNGTITGVSAGTATITASIKLNGIVLVSRSCKVTVKAAYVPPYIPPVNPNPSSSVTTTPTTNGTLTVTPSSATQGATVTVTATPNAGYELSALTVTDANGDLVALTANANGTYSFTMPNSKVTVSASFAKVAAKPLPYTDVADSAWYADAVRYVTENGLMNGITSTAFGPYTATTRGMLVTILYRLEGEPAFGASSFTDVADSQYYAKAIAWASACQIVEGYGNNIFQPDKSITREEMATILYRYASYKGYNMTARADLSVYSDNGAVSSYAVDAMRWANAQELITGVTNTTLVPQGDAVRAMAATILMRFCENIAK